LPTLSTFDLIALSNAFTGPFPDPSQTISLPSTKICALAKELILSFESFLTETSYLEIVKYFGISPKSLLTNNSNEASAPSYE